MEYRIDREFAEQADQDDPLRSFRDEFLIPQEDGHPKTYFLGNSLGLQPKRTREFIDRELKKWQDLAVDGHFRGDNPWFTYHQNTKQYLAELVGAEESEVVMMNNLTTNLHMLLVSFYRPVSGRYKVIMEAGAFPSDQYVIESQVKFHGYDPEDAIIELTPGEGEFTLRTEDILKVIDENKDESCLLFLGGVQYYTGQFFDIKSITSKAKDAGLTVGLDLAHAVGNVPLSLHSSNVDFAAWCGYKYLNGGPGGSSAIFVHEKHADRPDLPRFAGWWGHDEEARFQMEKGFIPMKGADGWQVSNSNIISAAALWASLEIFHEAELLRLREKSILLTGYLEFLLQSIPNYSSWFSILTPDDPISRGCQLSLFFHKDGRKVFDILEENGVVVDWREPNVIRAAPVPLYNTFTEVHKLYRIISEIVKD